MGSLDHPNGCVLASPVVVDHFAALRRRLGRRLRIAYVAGPGDVVGSFGHWQNGHHDPRTPVIAYSTQFFSAAQIIDADALLVSERPVPATSGHPRFTFMHAPRDRHGRGARYWRDELAYGLRIARLLADWRPDYVVMTGDLAISGYLPTAQRFDTFLTVHNTFWPMGQSPDGPAAAAKRVLWRLAFARIRGAVCTSEECRRQLVQVIGNPDAPIAVETPQILTAHLPTPTDRTRARSFLFVGRISRSKGVFDVLSAFRASADHARDARMDFAGSGPDLRLLQDEISRYDGPGRISYLGHLEAAHVHQVIEDHDVLVCPTRPVFKEGLALVVIEAASHGLPSIASSVVPAAESMNGSTLVYPASDPGAMAGEMRRLMRDPALYASLSQRAYGIREQSLDRTRSWGSALLRVLAEGGRHQPDRRPGRERRPTVPT